MSAVSHFDKLITGGVGTTMLAINVQAAWIAIYVGFIAGAIQGLFFHNEAWAGGYSSWARRLMRLGHVSFFGLAFINLAFVFSVQYLHLQPSALQSNLFILALIAMPTICYLSAWKDTFRHLFFIPVGSLLAATTLLLVDML